PVQGQWLHFSMGAATHFLVLREEFEGGSQAAAIALPGEFASGAHRARFSRFDGQLYVASSQGWANYGVQDGAVQRVRFTGGSYSYPVAYETRDNGILLTFASSQSEERFDRKNWFAQQWNYRYGPGYGSAEYSVNDPSVTGHDRVMIKSVQRLENGRQLFLEIPQMRPVNLLHLHCAGALRLELFVTIHRLGDPFTEFKRYQQIAKTFGVDVGVAKVDMTDPKLLMTACSACHHPEQRIVGPSLNEIRQRYASNPAGIVQWAMNPQNKNPQLPPMPSFAFLGEDKLQLIAEYILR
ncbi:MAG: c-type cytochrome, partial [Limisphaerales bacterium]